MDTFWLAFIPLFIAIDPVGNIALFVGLTQGFSAKEKKGLAIQAVVTAFIIGSIFGFSGKMIFRVIGITPSDFQVAGGILLLILSIKEMYGATAKNSIAEPHDRWVGVVPLGIPLTAGPAMITTLLILSESYSQPVIASALALNLVVALILFISADRITNLFGVAFSRVFAKVIAIFLAAIAVMMIRRGIESLLLS